MTWTYTGDPSVSDVAAVRFEIQDTDVHAQLLSDEEIAWAILQETTVAAGEPATIVAPNLWLAAAHCLEALAVQFAAQADNQVGQLKETFSKQAVNYAQRALEKRVKGGGGFSPSFPAMFPGDKRSMREGLEHPAFQRDQFDNRFGRRDGTVFPPMPT